MDYEKRKQQIHLRDKYISAYYTNQKHQNDPLRQTNEEYKKAYIKNDKLKFCYEVLTRLVGKK